MGLFNKKQDKKQDKKKEDDNSNNEVNKAEYEIVLLEKLGGTVREITKFDASRFRDDEDHVVYLKNDKKKFLEIFPQQINDFKNYFFECFEEAYFPVPNEIFLYAKLIDDIVIIGVNSIAKYSKIKNLFASKGLIEKKQMIGLEQILSHEKYRNKRKIILIHHYFSRHFSHTFDNNMSFLQKLESRANKLCKKRKLMKLFQNYKVGS